MACLNLDNNFLQRKCKTLKELQWNESSASKDKSPKGYIDEPIIPLISCINGTNAFYTTSSCSGRIALFLQQKPYHSTPQKGGEWLLISHDFIKKDEITNSIIRYKHRLNNTLINKEMMMITLLFEPFILHIECKDLLSAKQLLSMSRQIGLRESGINAINNRIMIRITFNLKLEVPLFHGDAQTLIHNELLPNINCDYIETLTDISNQKMKENQSKIQIFYQTFKSTFFASFKWFTAYSLHSNILYKQISCKMDILFKKMHSMEHKMDIKQKCDLFKGQWCLLVNHKYQKRVYNQLKGHHSIFAHHSPKYKHNWSYIPIKYQLAQNIMNAAPSINTNKLSYLRHLYHNTLSTHSKLYSFDIDLLIECVHVIKYYAEWCHILNEEDDSNGKQCIIIGLCFRCLPNIRHKLECIIYTRSNSEKWCSALISILSLLCNALELNEIILNNIINDFPTKYEILGDCILFPSCFERSLKDISRILPSINEVYDIICSYFLVNQIGVQQRIQKGIKRESGVKLLYDPQHKDGLVKHRENKIWYQFNVTKVMFSSGNLSEKVRIAQVAQSNDIVLDLYCGIGYFTLSLLIHCGVRFVYCCEINKNSIQSLKANMELNKIDCNRYQILEGDNAKTTQYLINQVDRVNLGLLPSSQQGWNPAIRAIKTRGGTLHIHHNVHIDHKQQFINNMIHRLQQIIKQYHDKKHWNIQILHCQHVKWYAPKIAHFVFDVKVE